MQRMKVLKMKGNLFIFLLQSGVYKRLLMLLIFSISVNAFSENQQEIGEPYFSFESRRHITIASDGKTFYVLSAKGMVSRYLISPFKKLETFQMPKIKFPFGSYGASKILAYDDERKWYFYNTKSLMRFDMQAKKIVNKVEFERFGDGAVVSGDRILALFSGKHSNQPIRNSNPSVGNNVYTFIEFHVWNKNDISKIKKVSYFDGSKLPKNRLTKFTNPVLLKFGDYILLSLLPRSGSDAYVTQQQPSFAIFDKNTLAPLFLASFRDARRNNDVGRNLRFSHDFSKVYLLNAEPYNARAFPNSRYQTPASKATLEIDLNTLKRKIVTMDWSEIESKTVVLDVGRGGTSSLHFSQSGNYASWWNQLFDAAKRQESMFYLFPDGEAVLQNKKTKQFQIIDNARQYLKMKNSAGEIVPMNDATFIKYNKLVSVIIEQPTY